MQNSRLCAHWFNGQELNRIWLLFDIDRGRISDAAIDLARIPEIFVEFKCTCQRTRSKYLAPEIRRFAQ